MVEYILWGWQLGVQIGGSLDYESRVKGTGNTIYILFTLLFMIRVLHVVTDADVWMGGPSFRLAIDCCKWRTCSTKAILHDTNHDAAWYENGWPTNFQSSTLSSNFLSFMTEQGARISAIVLLGNLLIKP